MVPSIVRSSGHELPNRAGWIELECSLLGLGQIRSRRPIDGVPNVAGRRPRCHSQVLSGGTRQDRVVRMPDPGFIQVIEAHGGDWWVVDDIRVVGVHLGGSEDDRMRALEAAWDQARKLSDNGCCATYSIGTILRCHAANLLLGEPGEEPGVDPGVVCRRGGWFDGDDED